MDEVYAPDVVEIFRSQTDNRTVFMIKPLSFLVALRQFQAFFAPYPLNPLVIDVPAFDLQQFCNLAVPVPAILLGKPDQSQPKAVLIFRDFPVVVG